MRLRSKTILTLAALLAIMAVVIVAIVSDAVISNALKEEKASLDDDLDRASTLVYSHNVDLRLNVKDWAVWDDSYAMVQGLDPDYVQDNLPNATMVNLRLNIVLFFNSSMGLVDAVGFDYSNGRPLDLTTATIDNITSAVTAKLSNGQAIWEGLMLLDHHLMFIACHEVKDTANTLPAMGTMVMARFIDAATMAYISDEIKVASSVFPIDAPLSSNLDPEVWNDTVLSGTVGYQTYENSTISASKAQMGIDGRPVAVLSVLTPRDIYSRAIGSIGLVSIILVIVICTFLVESLVVTDLFTFRRIDRLSQQVMEIGKGGKLSKRIQMDGSDELTDLASEVNRTIDAISLAEHRLAESEKRYRAIVNDQTELIFRMRPEGTITFANDALARELGLSSTEIAGLNSWDALPMFPSDLLHAQEEEAVATGRSITRDYRYSSDYGDEKWYSLSLRAIYSDGEIEEFQGVVRDLTEKMQAEMALVEVNKKLNLLASISRQSVMNQLIVAQGFVSIALTENQGLRTVEHLRKAEAALKAIQGHLEFTRDYQRAGMVMPVWINLKKSLEKMAPDFRAKGMLIDIGVSDFEVLADPLAERIFYNIMENSLRHGQGAKRMWIRAQSDDRGLVLTFEDDGKGVLLADKERIFEVGSGTSYSLFLAREIFSSAGVTITENGTEGEGACFEIVFPSRRYRHASE